MNGYFRVYVQVNTDEGDVEEFVIGRQVVGQRVVTRADGWMLSTDGSYYDPVSLPDPEPAWERERVIADLKAELLGVVKRTMLGRKARRARIDSVSLKARLGAFDSVAKLPGPVRDLVGTVEVA